MGDDPQGCSAGRARQGTPERSVNRLLRRLRSWGFWLIEPLDLAARRINRLGHYPPIALRRQVGTLGTLDGVGCEFVSYLRLLAGLKANDRLWDVGCGCALLELALETHGWRGPLLGVDIHQPCIRWAQKTVGRRMPSFRFLHADIYNAAYWPSGQLTAAEWFREFDAGEFDVVIAKSLFTHMLPDELDLYLTGISGRLGSGGRALLTFFLLNEAQRNLERAGRNSIRLLSVPESAVYRVRRPGAPTAAVAYEEAYIRERLGACQLEIQRAIQFGNWTGRSDGLSYQDILIVRKQGQASRQ